MKLVQIGYNVRSLDHCGFRCQSGLSDNRPMRLTFTTRGPEAKRQIDNFLALNKH